MYRFLFLVLSLILSGGSAFACTTPRVINYRLPEAILYVRVIEILPNTDPQVIVPDSCFGGPHYLPFPGRGVTAIANPRLPNDTSIFEEVSRGIIQYLEQTRSPLRGQFLVVVTQNFRHHRPLSLQTANAILRAHPELNQRQVFYRSHE